MYRDVFIDPSLVTADEAAHAHDELSAIGYVPVGVAAPGEPQYYKLPVLVKTLDEAKCARLLAICHCFTCKHGHINGNIKATTHTHAHTHTHTHTRTHKNEHTLTKPFKNSHTHKHTKHTHTQ